MGDLRSIDGGKKRDEPLCVYCGYVPETLHPALSCPRIAAVTYFGDGTVERIDFVDPEEWAAFLAAMTGETEEEPGEEKAE